MKYNALIYFFYKNNVTRVILAAAVNVKAIIRQKDIKKEHTLKNMTD